ncbi:hypothetical protein B0H13DRAFT_2276000 [Mycena leptocephala]|nr:hypothetical protein B0H13DRAFT_2276000 [Mycena leptocephala]
MHAVEGKCEGEKAHLLLRWADVARARFKGRTLTLSIVGKREKESMAVWSPIIVLPSLETLIMTFNGEADSGPVDGLEAFFMPLALPSLTKIDFTFDPNDEEVWPTEVFLEFQTLDIEFGWNSVDDDFWDALRYDDTDSAPIAPKLQDIVFFCVGDFNEGPLEEAIGSEQAREVPARRAGVPS